MKTVRDRWVVNIFGGSTVLDGRQAVGIIVTRPATALTSAEAAEVGRTNFVAELRERGAEFDEAEVQVVNCWQLDVLAKDPSEFTTHFLAA